MSTSTNGIACWSDLSSTQFTRGATLSQCPTKSEIQSAIKSGYQVTIGGSYSNNQLVRYSHISVSQSTVTFNIQFYLANGSLYWQKNSSNYRYELANTSGSLELTSTTNPGAPLGTIFTGNGTCKYSNRQTGAMSVDGDDFTVTCKLVQGNIGNFIDIQSVIIYCGVNWPSYRYAGISFREITASGYKGTLTSNSWGYNMEWYDLNG